MFNFFHAVFVKVVSGIVSTIAAIGIISSPIPHSQLTPQVATVQLPPNQPSPQIVQRPEKSTPDKNGDIQSAEIEKLKKEVEDLKNRKVSTPSVKTIQEQPKPTVAQEIPKQRPNYDQELSQLIAEARQRIDTFNKAVQETTDFIPVIQNTLDKYPSDPAVQSSGQQLLGENNKLGSISEKLVEIETQRVSKLSSYLGLGILPTVEDFSSLNGEYNDYYRQYETSNSQVEVLMKTFVANRKSALEERVAKEQQELNELKTLLSQQIATRQKTLTDLKTQIDRWQQQYDDNCAGSSERSCVGRRAEAVRHLTPLINQYNALLGNASGKIYSPVSQTYLRFQADPSGYGGTLYDESGGSSVYTFNCDQYGNCTIYSQ